MSKFIIFKKESDLQNFFKNNTLYLSKSSIVKTKSNVVFGNNIIFEGSNIIGHKTKILSNCKIINSNIGEENIIRDSTIVENCNIKSCNLIGPFCFIRDSKINKKNIIGTFVEMARSICENNNKISHRAYIGDTRIFSNVIIGAGVTTCNYKNNKRYKCTIKSNVLVGSGTQLIAKVVIGENSIIAAGSIVNKNIKVNTKLIQKRSTLLNTIR